MLKDSIEIEDGEVVIPDDPGFGITPDHNIVEKHAYTEDKVHTINLFEKGWKNERLTDGNGCVLKPQLFYSYLGFTSTLLFVATELTQTKGVRY